MREQTGRDRSGLVPLRRRPKQLTEEPTVFDWSSGGAGGVFVGDRGDAVGRGRRSPGGSARGITNESGLAAPAETGAVEIDPVVRDRARQIAARLSVRRPRTDPTGRRGTRALTSMPYRDGSDEIDLDRSIEVIAERPHADDDDMIVRDRVRTRRAVVLAIDVSGSMKGERVETAAATVGALVAELRDDALGVIAFWSDAAILLRLDEKANATDVLEKLLRMPARGLTNLSFPLELAARALAGSPLRNARVVLLSDCVHNAGPDPREVARRLRRLDVLIDVSGEKDLDLGRQLATAGRGTANIVRDFRDVAPALNRIFRT